MKKSILILYLAIENAGPFTGLILSLGSKVARLNSTDSLNRLRTSRTTEAKVCL